MKKRISATIDEKTLKIIEEFLKDGDYRNKSHVIERAIELLKKIKGKKRK
ncbi:MAG TPA: ribbon-helix-helix protein, CopG family [Candidatus Paceibacterota bacterium]|nr:ribbon-helix-helix protein, CopG family [Candidatus Paceibacterota bacterium]